MKKRTYSLWKMGAALGVILLIGKAALALEPVYKNQENVAIHGYDPVAYHLAGRAVAGDGAHSFVWNDATWYFLDAGNRERFASEPERWAPRYGGYCAWAVANNYVASIDPEAWSIVEENLYLNYSKSVRARWERDIPGNIQHADKNWPELLGGK